MKFKNILLSISLIGSASLADHLVSYNNYPILEPIQPVVSNVWYASSDIQYHYQTGDINNISTYHVTYLRRNGLNAIQNNRYTQQPVTIVPSQVIQPAVVVRKEIIYTHLNSW